ncbi:MAG: hypothetical protein HQL80_03985 [Magnetococcales bacterium]|nr:hypothetical protein [Magnetococcales bacterium]
MRLNLINASILIGVLVIFVTGGFVARYVQKEHARELQVAREAEREEQHRRNVYTYAGKAAEWVVKKVYDGGVDVSWDVDDWGFNSYKGEYKIKTSIQWRGRVFGGNEYAASGYIRADINGSNLRWESTWHSTNLQEYLEKKHFLEAVIGAIVTLGAIEEAGQR